jgi:dienelactone hydrolase
MTDLDRLTMSPSDYDPNAIQLPHLQIGPSLAQWEQQRQALRGQWLEFLGHGPEQVPLEPQILSEQHFGDVCRTLVSYQVEDGCRVEAYVMQPTDGECLPAVLVLHPTTSQTIESPAGTDTRPSLRFSVNLARRGYVTVTPRNYLWQYRGVADERWHESQTTRLLLETWPQWTGMGKMLWDCIRATDYMATLENVDPRRLGCAGHSLGAKEVLYAMAFDPRLRAGLSCEGGVGISFSNWDAPWYLGKRIHTRPDLDHHQLLALAAPRALLIIGGGAEPGRRAEGTSPGADGPLTWNYLEAARPAYALYGASNALGYLLHDEGHYLPPRHEHVVYDWFAHFLGGGAPTAWHRET